MADVFRATDAVLGRVVAVKTLADRYAADDEFRARFTREALTAASLSHPNVVTIFDVGEHDGTPFIVMEYLAGGSLADRLRDGPSSTGHGHCLARPGRRGARRRTRCRHRSSRHQARQPAARRPRRGARLRLRHRARGRARSADVNGHHPGQLGVHGARAGTRGARHLRQRPVRARLRGLRAADRTPSVRSRVTDGRGDPPRLSAAAPRIRDRTEPARGGGRSAGPRPGEEPRRPAAKLQGTCQRLTGCAAGGRRADALHSPFRKRRADGCPAEQPSAGRARRGGLGAGGRRHRGRPRVEQRGRRPAAHCRRHRDRARDDAGADRHGLVPASVASARCALAFVLQRGGRQRPGVRADAGRGLRGRAADPRGRLRSARRLRHDGRGVHGLQPRLHALRTRLLP